MGFQGGGCQQFCPPTVIFDIPLKLCDTETRAKVICMAQHKKRLVLIIKQKH